MQRVSPIQNRLLRVPQIALNWLFVLSLYIVAPSRSKRIYALKNIIVSAGAEGDRERESAFNCISAAYYIQCARKGVCC